MMATSNDHPNTKQTNPGQRYDSGLGSLKQQPNAVSLNEVQVPQYATDDHDDPELQIFQLEYEDEQDEDLAYVSLGDLSLSSLQLTSMPLITTINESPPVVDPDVDVYLPDTTENDPDHSDMNNDTSFGSTTTMISTSRITKQGVHSISSPNEAEGIHDHSPTYEEGLAVRTPFPSTLLSNVTSQPIEIIIREQIAEGSDFDQERVLTEPKVPSPS